MALARSQIAGRLGYWLVEIDLGGELLRYSTEALDVPTADGSTLKFRAGLVGFSAAYGDLDQQGITIEDPSRVWAVLAAQGQRFDRLPATLRRWYSGMVWEASRLALDGLASAPVYGYPSAPGRLDLELRSTVADLGRVLPQPQQVVDATTWPVAGSALVDDTIVGAYYPVVIGKPGNLDPGPAVPALLVESIGWVGALAPYGGYTASKLLVAGHSVAATEVTVHDMSAKPSAPMVRPIIETVDKLGQVVSCIDWQVSSGSPYAFGGEPGRKWFTGWHEGGGLQRRGALVRGLADVLEWLAVEHSDLAVDVGALRAQGATLNRYKVDATINGPVNALDWIRSTLESVYPIREVRGARGAYWAHVRHDWAASDAVAHLSTELGQVRREGPLGLRDAEVFNEITVEYDQTQLAGRYRRLAMVTAEARRPTIGAKTADARVAGSLRCAVSQATYGVRPMTVQAPTIGDEATAFRVARDLADAQAMPRRWGRWSGSLELESLPILSPVVLTDPEAALDQVLAVVESIEVRERDVVLELTLHEEPARARVRTA